MKLTGAEIVVEMLCAEGMPYAIGIPGHGNLPLVEALRQRRARIGVIMPRHEQAAVHMADGYFRACHRPLAVFTSIGAGAANTAIGLATAYVDSIPLLLLIGETHTYMRGVGVLQELERQHWSDMPRMLYPAVKRAWRVDQAGQLGRAVAQALNAMGSGRPGPALIDLPMDVQAEAVELAELPDPRAHRAALRPAPASEGLRQAAELLLGAERPVILAGGGVILAEAEAELRALAEHLGACVLTTMQGKGALAEDHPLYAWHLGVNATTCGNHMARSADVLLAVGVRFADKTCCSYRPGESLNIPPTRLIHADIDPQEIGKNYPVACGLVGDAKATLAGLLAAVRALGPAREWAGSAYAREIAEEVAAWRERSRVLRECSAEPVTMGRAIAEIRAALPAEAVVTTSSGNIQAQVFQEMPFSLPRTYLSAGGFSTMGWAYPAALGAKLARPDRPAVALVGDGDFLMTMQELATAVQYRIPAVAVVFNNVGWQAIRDLQLAAYGADSVYATLFERDGQPVTPRIAEAAQAFGALGVRVTRPGEVEPALRAALEAGGPAVVEVMVDTQPGSSGGLAPGWWDVPVPPTLAERRAAWEQGRREERV
ncbi:MAG: thiamine pyrophosphate-binding protein [Anaerolineae bacterium]